MHFYNAKFHSTDVATANTCSVLSINIFSMCQFIQMIGSIIERLEIAIPK